MEEAWVPKTELGRKVLQGEITSMRQVMEQGLPILETQIVDRLLPNLDSEILDINRVQRRDRSGRKLRYRVTVAVGNRDGYIGIGQGKAKEVYNSIQKAIEDAKKNIICIRRGCGSWECGCGRPHTVPFRVTGKSGSVEVTLIPAPRGVDLAAGDVARVILELAGIQDVWSKVRGQTQTTLNFAMATFNALKKTNEVQVKREHEEVLGIALAETKPIEVAPAPKPLIPEEKIEEELKDAGLDEEELEISPKDLEEVEELEPEEESEEESEEPEEEAEAEPEGEGGEEDEDLAVADEESKDEEE